MAGKIGGLEKRLAQQVWVEYLMHGCCTWRMKAWTR